MGSLRISSPALLLISLSRHFAKEAGVIGCYINKGSDSLSQDWGYSWWIRSSFPPMGGSRTILSTSPGRHLRQRTFEKYNMPKHTIHLHYLKGNDTDSNFTTGPHYLLYINTISILHYSSFLSLLVASLSGVGDHSSARFIEGGGLKRSSSPPRASPAIP